MNIINNAIKSTHHLNLFEIGLFKFYIVSTSFLLSIWFPKLLSASLWFYVVVFFILYVYFMIRIIKKEGNIFKEIFLKGFKIQLFSKMNIFDLTIFKLTVFFAGLVIAILFPIVLTAHIGWYIGISALGAGYFSNMFFYHRNR